MVWCTCIQAGKILTQMKYKSPKTQAVLIKGSHTVWGNSHRVASHLLHVEWCGCHPFLSVVVCVCSAEMLGKHCHGSAPPASPCSLLLIRELVSLFWEWERKGQLQGFCFFKVLTNAGLAWMWEITCAADRSPNARIYPPVQWPCLFGKALFPVTAGLSFLRALGGNCPQWSETLALYRGTARRPIPRLPVSHTRLCGCFFLAILQRFLGAAVREAELSVGEYDLEILPNKSCHLHDLR